MPIIRYALTSVYIYHPLTQSQIVAEAAVPDHRYGTITVSHYTQPHSGGLFIFSHLIVVGIDSFGGVVGSQTYPSGISGTDWRTGVAFEMSPEQYRAQYTNIINDHYSNRIRILELQGDSAGAMELRLLRDDALRTTIVEPGLSADGAPGYSAETTGGEFKWLGGSPFNFDFSRASEGASVNLPNIDAFLPRLGSDTLKNLGVMAATIAVGGLVIAAWPTAVVFYVTSALAAANVIGIGAIGSVISRFTNSLSDQVARTVQLFNNMESGDGPSLADDSASLAATDPPITSVYQVIADVRQSRAELTSFQAFSDADGFGQYLASASSYSYLFVGDNFTTRTRLSGEAVSFDAYSRVVHFGSMFRDQVTGSRGNDLIFGFEGNDSIAGGAGNDTIEGGVGNDGIDGGTGNDAALFSIARSDYYVRSFVSGGQFYTQVTAASGTDGVDTLVNIETLGFNNGGQSFGLAGIQQNLVSNIDGSYFDDVLFQNSATGQIIYQNMNAGTASGFGSVLGSLPSGWRLVGSDDFTGDGRADVLVQNTANGSIYTVNIASGSAAWTAVTTGLTSAYQAIASGDVTRDGTADVLVRDAATGQTFIADINAGGAFGGWLAGPNLGTGWRTVGLGDFNRDGASDVLVQNIADGTTYYRDMLNGQWGSVSGAVGSQWVARESADLNGDGYCDVVLQNSSTGDIWWVNMLGGSNAGWNVVANGLSGWEVRGSADVDNDGWRDVIIQNTSTGTTYYANMNNGVFGGFGTVSGAVGTQWLAVA